MAKGDDLERIVLEMKRELERSRSLRMPHQGDVFPNYISYVFTFTDCLDIVGDLGSSMVYSGSEGLLEAEMRVDRGKGGVGGYAYAFEKFFPDPGEGVVEVALWRMTNGLFKEALVDHLARRKTEQVSPTKAKKMCFASTGPVERREEMRDPGIDLAVWRGIVEGCTSLFRTHEKVISSSMDFSAKSINRLLVNSEGSELFTNSRYYSIDMAVSAISKTGNLRTDGDTVVARRQIYLSHPADLPSQDVLMSETRKMLGEIDALLEAPHQEPSERPAIFDADASAQLLYTLLCTNVLSRCAASHDPSRELVRKGDILLPDFISVSDMPGLEMFTVPGRMPARLNGYSCFDEQGVPCQDVDLVKDGKVADFLTMREYPAGVGLPNGHGRFGNDGVLPGITNLFVGSRRSASREELVGELIRECERKGLDYGFFFVGSLGSEVDTSENYYNLTPRLAYRVWAKDAYDKSTKRRFRKGDLQLVRDVQVVGNPKISLSNLVMTGDDPSVVVPDSIEGLASLYQGEDTAIVCPSTLFSRVELKKEFYSKVRPPILPHPFHGRGGYER